MIRILSLLLTVVLASTPLFAQSERGDVTEATTKPLFNIKAKKTAAQPGQFVLCPSRQFYENGLKKGPDKTTFIYYAAKLVEAKADYSIVRNLAGRKFKLPNQLIVPVPAGQKAEKGDVLLTWWQSGSGMQRAIVTGGTQFEPVVRFLDVQLNNPSGVGRKEEKLKPDSFYVLKSPFQVGTTVASKAGRSLRHGQIVYENKDKLLVREFGGKLVTYPRSACISIPIHPDVKPGVAVEAAIYGSMKPVSVTKVDATIGRVFVKFQLGRKEREMAIAFGNLLTK